MTQTPPSAPLPQSGRSRLLFLLVAVLILSLLVLMAVQLFSLGADQAGTIHIGESTSELEFIAYTGEPIRLESYLGQVVVLNFWASWCQPCEDEAALLQNAWEYYQPGGEVVFLGAAYLDTQTAAQDYLQQFGITYPSGLDRRSQLAARLGLTGVPETFFINRQGNLVYHQIGPFISLPQILALVDSALE
jgi:cytochrome c biogenesis protein CcmG/thiol:disulfide interchange protein DsbE